MMEVLPYNKLIRVVVRLWAVWHARCKAIYENIFQSSLPTYCFVERFITELEMLKSSPKSQQLGRYRFRSGYPLRMVLLKINVDATMSKNSNTAAVAAVGRSACWSINCGTEWDNGCRDSGSA